MLQITDTIIKRRRKNGTIAWLAQISVMRQGKALLCESQTFERRSTAAAWIENRKEGLARPGALDALKTQPKSEKTPTLADAIDRYVGESNKLIGRTKTQVLKSIKTFDIADQHCDAITSADIVEFAQEKLNCGVQPQTVANYLAYLGAVFSIARPTWAFHSTRRLCRTPGKWPSNWVSPARAVNGIGVPRSKN